MNYDFLSSDVPLVLASASPRRHNFLKGLGLNFLVQTAGVDEQIFAGETPREFVTRLSLAKAKAVASHHKEAWVIGADTVVAIDDDVLGKPADPKAALEMLRRLNGHWHEVWTGFAVHNNDKKVSSQQTVRTRVKFWQHSDVLLKAYVKTQESLDKAGAYGIQGKGGLLVEKIEGSYSNVVGLPLAELISILLELGVVSPGES